MKTEYPICNCDGYWHVEINGTTYYLDLQKDCGCTYDSDDPEWIIDFCDNHRLEWD